MIQLFRNLAFVKLFIANFASHLGSIVGNMAFAFYMLDRFSSQPYYATLAELMYALPVLIVFPFVGVLADRLDRKRIAANSDWIRAGLTALLLLSVYENWIVAAFALLFLRSAVAKFFVPAEMGLLQGIMSSEQYIQAAGLNQMVMGMFMLFGMGLGAASYHYFGIEGAILIDCCSFLISGALVASCRFAPEVRLPNGKSRLKEIGMRSILGDFREGIIYIRNHKLLLAIISGYFMFGIIDGVFAVLPIFTMKYKLSPDEYETYSPLVMVFLGIGFMIGSAVCSTLVKRFSALAVLIVGLFGSGALIVVFAGISNVWVYLALILIVGILVSPVNVVLGGLVPELVEPSKMGRVSAWFEPVLMLAQSMTLGFIAIAFPSFVSVGTLYVVVGICLLTVSIYYWLVLPALFRKHKHAVVPSNQSQIGLEA